MSHLKVNTSLEILERIFPGYFYALSELHHPKAEALQAKAYQRLPEDLCIEDLAHGLSLPAETLLTNLEGSYREWLLLETPTEKAFEQIQKRGNDCLIVDLREAWEAAIVSIEGAIRPEPFAPEALRDQALAAQEVLLYCHHGVRSRYVAAYMRDQGLQNVHSVRGGIHALALHFDPPLPRY